MPRLVCKVRCLLLKRGAQLYADKRIIINYKAKVLHYYIHISMYDRELDSTGRTG